MGITVSKLASNKATVTLTYGDESVNIEYVPSKVTEKIFADMLQLSSIENATGDEATVATQVLGAAKSLNDLLVQLVSSWDVFEDDAQTQMFPLDIVRLPELPLKFRMQAIMAVFGDIKGEAVAAG